MGDIDNCHVLRLQVLDDAEQGLHLILGQGGRGLVQDQHPAVGGNGLGDLHRLHLRNAQLAHLLPGVKVHAHLFQQGGGIGVHFIVVDHGEYPQEFFHRIAAQEDILTHSPGGNGLKLLVHHGNALAQGVHGIMDGDGLTIDLDLALIHFVDAEHTLHQRGLTGAVLAHQGVDLAGTKLQLGMIQCFHAWKRLAYAGHFQHILGHASNLLLWILNFKENAARCGIFFEMQLKSTLTKRRVSRKTHPSSSDTMRYRAVLADGKA